MLEHAKKKLQESDTGCSEVFTWQQRMWLDSILTAYDNGQDERIANIVHSRVSEHMAAHITNSHDSLPKFDLEAAIERLTRHGANGIIAKALRAYHNGADEPEAATDATIADIERNYRRPDDPPGSTTIADELEQTRVQLAGVFNAAEGHISHPAKEGNYGWSPTYQAVLDLRRKYDLLLHQRAERTDVTKTPEPERPAPAYEVGDRVTIDAEVHEVDERDGTVAVKVPSIMPFWLQADEVTKKSKGD